MSRIPTSPLTEFGLVYLAHPNGISYRIFKLSLDIGIAIGLNCAAMLFGPFGRFGSSGSFDVAHQNTFEAWYYCIMYWILCTVANDLSMIAASLLSPDPKMCIQEVNFTSAICDMATSSTIIFELLPHPWHTAHGFFPKFTVPRSMMILMSIATVVFSAGKMFEIANRETRKLRNFGETHPYYGFFVLVFFIAFIVIMVPVLSSMLIFLDAGPFAFELNFAANGMLFYCYWVIIISLVSEVQQFMLLQQQSPASPSSPHDGLHLAAGTLFVVTGMMLVFGSRFVFDSALIRYEFCFFVWAVNVTLVMMAVTSAMRLWLRIYGCVFSLKT